MIPFDFEYHSPTSIHEAIQLFQELSKNGFNPIYYSGGTEIISFARKGALSTKAIIDIKKISECNVLDMDQNQLVIGAALSLTQVEEANLFPLLSQVSKQIADHTSRNKITLGGNIMGKIIYQEAVLPLLLSDSHVVLAGDNGEKILSIHDIFQNGRTIQNGDLLVQIRIEERFTSLPFSTIRKTKIEKIDYPLVSVASLKMENKVRVAFSGICDYPFRMDKIETELNNGQYSLEDRVSNALKHLPSPVRNDLFGSSDYRYFVLNNVLLTTLEQFEGVSS